MTLKQPARAKKKKMEMSHSSELFTEVIMDAGIYGSILMLLRADSTATKSKQDERSYN